MLICLLSIVGLDEGGGAAGISSRFRFSTCPSAVDCLSLLLCPFAVVEVEEGRSGVGRVDVEASGCDGILVLVDCTA